MRYGTEFIKQRCYQVMWTQPDDDLGACAVCCSLKTVMSHHYYYYLSPLCFNYRLDCRDNTFSFVQYSSMGFYGSASFCRLPGRYVRRWCSCHWRSCYQGIPRERPSWYPTGEVWCWLRQLVPLQYWKVPKRTWQCCEEGHHHCPVCRCTYVRCWCHFWQVHAKLGHFECLLHHQLIGCIG